MPNGPFNSGTTGGSGGGGSVDSVNGDHGPAVVLDADDIGAAGADERFQLVFVQGGTDGPGVYSDWSDLVNSLQSRDPRDNVQIRFSNDFANPVVLPAGNWSIPCTMDWIGTSLGGPTTVHLADGFVLSQPDGGMGLRSIQDNFELFVQADSAGSNVSPFAPTSNPAALYLFRGATLQNDGDVPVIQALAGNFVVLAVVTFCNIVGPGPILDLPATSVGLVVAADGANVDSDIFQGAGGVQILVVSSSANYSTTQTGLGSPVSIILFEHAEKIAYSPDVGANWDPPPTQVAEALDQLAAAVTAGGGSQDAFRTVLIYEPGGTANEQVYVDWSELIDAFQDRDPADCVEIRFSSAFQNPIVLPAGTWDIPCAMDWLGPGITEIARTVHLEDGFLLTNPDGRMPLRIVQDSLLVRTQADSGGSNVIPFQPTAGFTSFGVTQGAMLLTDGDLPLIMIPNATEFTIDLINFGELQGPIAFLDVGAICNVLLGVGATSAANTFTGTGQLNFVVASSGATYSTSQGGFTGIIQQVLLEEAQLIVYAEGSPINWSGPVDHVAGALDELASRVRTIENDPTPGGNHAETHQHAGVDEVATDTPIANGIPKALGSGELDPGWLPYATTSTEGVVFLAYNNGTTAGTVVEATDSRLSDDRYPTTHAANHQYGGGDEVATQTPVGNGISQAGGSGNLARGWLVDEVAYEDEDNAWTGENEFLNLVKTQAVYRKVTPVNSTPYTVLSSDHIIYCGDSAGTVNLPAATGSGRELIVERSGTANITVDADGSETINGATTQVMTVQYQSITLIDVVNGQWRIV